MASTVRVTPPAAGAAEQRSATGTAPDADLFSCDVFDTVITRAVGLPTSLFLLLGRKLRARGLIEISADAFVAARRNADRQARLNNGRGWDLPSIYRELQYALDLDDATRDAVMAAELALERELLRAVPGAAERIAAARAAGMRVVFLSDMYVDSAFIRSVLAEHGLCTDGDGCYVSSETGVGKEDGRAFHELAQREGVALRRVLHRGNHPTSDVLAARRVGVLTQPSPEPNPNRYELALETWASATEGLSSVMAGASRLARLSVAAATPREAALRDVAAGVGAPLVVSYVLWLLLEARRTGIRRLYFMARDGWLLLRVAKKLAAKLGVDIELRYLYGGRRAWYGAALTNVEEDDLSWTVDHAAAGDSIDSFMRKLALDPAEFAVELESLGHPRSSWNAPMPRDRHAQLWAIAKHPTIRRQLLERAARKRAAVLAYCEQEGLLEDVRWAIVDVGWSGRVVAALDRILGQAGAGVPEAFFFGRFVDVSASPLNRNLPIRSWFSDHVRRTGYVKLVSELYMELFCGAAHGVVVGYDAQPSAIAPRFETTDNPRLTAWGLPLVHETILSFVDELWLDAEAVNIAANMRPAVAEVFWKFARRPSAEEAAAWGAYPFEYGRLGVLQSTIAARYHARHIVQALRHGTLTNRTHTEWREAGMMLTPQPLRFILRACLGVRRRLVSFARQLHARRLTAGE